MEVISFRCSACKQVLKIGADKAGRKAKCKCGAEVVIPSASASAEPPAAPPPLPPPPPPKADEDDDDGGSYGLIGDFDAPSSTPAEKPGKKRGGEEDDEDEEKDKEAKPKEKSRGRPKITKARFLVEPEKWTKVCTGLQIVSVGLWIYLGALALREVPFIIGLFNPPDYAQARLRWEDPRLYAQMAPPGASTEPFTKSEFLVALVTGNDSVTLGLWFLRIPAILMVIASLTLLAGYVTCLVVPDRFGTRGQALTLTVLAALNTIFTIVFRVLPAFGVMDYTLIPIVLPELALLNANLERDVPLAVLLSARTMLDYLLSFVILMTFTLEPAILAIFLRGVARSMRNLDLQETAEGMISMSLGTAFILLTYVMLIATGTSDVLEIVLKLLYGLGLGFLLGEFIWYPIAVAKFPPLIRKELGTEDEWGEGSGRPKPADEEEDEEDDEDEDEDE